MVVITAFLLKKAYDRYNSSNSDGNISASEHTRNTNTDNYPTQQLRRINSSPDRLNSYQRRATTTNNNNNSNTTHRVVNGRIYKTRKRSSYTTNNNTNRRYSSTASNSNSRYNFRNIMTIETNKKEEVIIPTKYGYFVSSPKTKIISLPPETIPPNYNVVPSLHHSLPICQTSVQRVGVVHIYSISWPVPTVQRCIHVGPSVPQVLQ